MAKNMNEKTKRIEETRDRRPKAVAKYIRISPYKVRPVLDLVRGKSYAEAVALLEHLQKSAADPVKKAIMSAGANAEHNLQMAKSDLYVAACYADQGPTLKRMRPRAQGRAYRILKRTSHITVVLDVKGN